MGISDIGDSSPPNDVADREPNDRTPSDRVELLGVVGADREPGRPTAQVTNVRSSESRRWPVGLFALLAVGVVAVALAGGSTDGSTDDESTEPVARDANPTGIGAEPSDTEDSDPTAQRESETIGPEQGPDNSPSIDVPLLTIVDGAEGWRPLSVPAGAELVRVDGDLLIAQASLSASEAAAGGRVRLWISPDGETWSETEPAPAGVLEVRAEGSLLWATPDDGDLIVSADAGQTWLDVPDDGQPTTSPLLTRYRSIGVAASDSDAGTTTFQTEANWFVDVLAYETDLGDGTTQCTARTSEGIAIHDTDDCSGTPMLELTYDELELTPQERSVLRDPRRFTISSFWQIDAAGRLWSLRALDESGVDGQPVGMWSSNGVVTVRQRDGTDHRLVDDVVTVERRQDGVDGPLAHIGETQFGALRTGDATTVTVRSTDADVPGGVGPWMGTEIPADLVAGSANVFATVGRALLDEGVATAEETVVVFVTEDGETWVRTAGADITGQPSIDALLVAGEMIVVGVADDAGVEWFALDIAP